MKSGHKGQIKSSPHAPKPGSAGMKGKPAMKSGAKGKLVKSDYPDQSYGAKG
jgi:hypothetical protein